MKSFDTDLSGVKIIELDKYEDSRGFFYESYNKKKYSAVGIDYDFVQDNHSFSKKNIFRGLHFQKKPFAQNKLIRVLDGEVIDVIVNLNPRSKYYKKYKLINLNSKKNQILFVPKNYAHGFYVLSESAHLLYKVDKYRSIESERTINLYNKKISIKWPKNFKPLLNKRDKISNFDDF